MSEDQALDQAFNPDFRESAEEVLHGDIEILAFIKEWLSNGMNAALAYKTLHPEVSDQSSRVLGSRKLAKVNFEALLATYGLGIQEYIEHLKVGLGSMRWNDATKEQEADFRTRKGYLDILGKLHRLYKL